MPLTPKGQKVERKLEAEYGAKKGKSVLYALKAEGKLTGVDKTPPGAGRNDNASAGQPQRMAGRPTNCVDATQFVAQSRPRR